MFSNKIKIFLAINLFLSLILFFYYYINSYKIKIVDGDTIYLNGEKIRFEGIDSPELNQICEENTKKVYCGVKARNLLIDTIGDNKVHCVKKGKDKYRRTLAECFVKNLSLSRYLVRNGYAFAYRKYSKKFINDENFAKANNNGIWSMKFEYPWDYRKNN